MNWKSYFVLPDFLFVAIVIILFIIWVPQRGSLPRFWYDEAINVRLSRNLAEQGYLNLQTSPGEEYAKPYQFQTSGYPLTAPLTALFKISGFSFELARGYMFTWFTVFLLTVYTFCSRIYGNKWLGLASVAMLSSFPPVLYHGLSVIGEIPAVTLLILSALFLDKFTESRQRRYILLFGLLLGLAIAAKPLLLPVIIPAIYILWSLKVSRRELGASLASFALPLLVFAVIVLPANFNVGDFVATYASRASQSSFFENIASNLGRFTREFSLMHAALLGLAVLALHKRLTINHAMNFLLLCALVMFLFFLQSVGWNRYLVTTQIILVMLLPLLLKKVIPRFTTVLLLVLIASQTVYAFTKSELVNLRGDWAARVDEMIKENAPRGDIYVIMSAAPAALIDSSRLYFFTRFEGKPQMPNKLSDLTTNKFDYIISKPNHPDLLEFKKDVTEYYTEEVNLDGLSIFARKSQPPRPQD